VFTGLVVLYVAEVRPEMMRLHKLAVASTIK